MLNMKTIKEFINEYILNIDEDFSLGNIPGFEIEKSTQLITNVPRDIPLTIVANRVIKNKLYIVPRENKYVKGVNASTHAFVFTKTLAYKFNSTVNDAIKNHAIITLLGVLDTNKTKISIPYDKKVISDETHVLKAIYTLTEFNQKWEWLSQLFDEQYIILLKQHLIKN